MGWLRVYMNLVFYCTFLRAPRHRRAEDQQGEYSYAVGFTDDSHGAICMNHNLACRIDSGLAKRAHYHVFRLLRRDERTVVALAMPVSQRIASSPSLEPHRAMVTLLPKAAILIADPNFVYLSHKGLILDLL